MSEQQGSHLNCAEVIFAQYSTTEFYEVRKRVFDAHYTHSAPFGLACLELSGKEQVLEIGCGIGDDTVELVKRLATSEQLHTIDQSPAMVDYTRARLLRELPGRALPTLRVMDANNLAYPPPIFDQITAINVLYHLDHTRALARFAAALRPDGSLIATAFFAEGYRNLQAVFRDPLGEAGKTMHAPIPGGSVFTADAGEQVLREHFEEVESVLDRGYYSFRAPDDLLRFFGTLQVFRDLAAKDLEQAEPVFEAVRRKIESEIEAHGALIIHSPGQTYRCRGPRAATGDDTPSSARA